MKINYVTNQLAFYKDFLDKGNTVLLYILAQAPYLITAEEQVLLTFLVCYYNFITQLTLL